MQPLLPVPRRAHDEFEVVVPGLPTEHLAGFAVARHERRRVARPTRSFLDREVNPGDAAYGVDHLAHAVTVAVAAVQHGRSATVLQVTERIQMRPGEIVHMDVVAHACAVRRRVVGAVDLHARPLPERGLAGDLDQLRRRGRGLSDARLGISAGDVEVAQDDVAQAACRPHVLEHALGHHLRCAIGIDRCEGRGLVDEDDLRFAVDRAGRREHHVAHAVTHRQLEQP